MKEKNFKNILIEAQQNQFAIGQFNISNLEGLRAVAEVAKEQKAPVIVGTSEGERKFIGRRQIVKLIEAYGEELEVSIVVNADHTKSFEEIKLVVDAGYGAIHFDGSALSFEENVKITKEAVDYAKSKDKNIIVEGELGYLRGGSQMHEAVEIKEEDLTKPEEAEKFVASTGIDSLAIAIGNVHGMVKGGNPKLRIDKLTQIKEAVPGTFLVLHGASGISENDVRMAVKAGITKVNVNTELRLAYTNSLKKFLSENPEQTTPYKIFPDIISAMKKVIEGKIKLFGS